MGRAGCVNNILIVGFYPTPARPAFDIGDLCGALKAWRSQARTAGRVRQHSFLRVRPVLSLFCVGEKRSRKYRAIREAKL